MSLFHERWRRRTSLLAARALEGREREEAERHLATCVRCREEHTGLAAALGWMESDPARTASLPLPLPALLTRVRARLDAAPPASATAWRAWQPLTAAAAALALVAGVVVWRGPGGGAPASPPMPAAAAAVPDDVLRRMEGRVAREQAARYLAEAQDVLVTVASHGPDCDREQGRVDVGAEARRSRELLARRALLVETERAEIAGARAVLEDVDELLREVAALPSCARAGELAAIHRAMERRRLLMKIDLMTQELAG
jgi:hypothetical protein